MQKERPPGSLWSRRTRGWLRGSRCQTWTRTWGLVPGSAALAVGPAAAVREGRAVAPAECARAGPSGAPREGAGETLHWPGASATSSVSPGKRMKVTELMRAPPLGPRLSAESFGHSGRGSRETAGQAAGRGGGGGGGRVRSKGGGRFHLGRQMRGATVRAESRERRGNRRRKTGSLPLTPVQTPGKGGLAFAVTFQLAGPAAAWPQPGTGWPGRWWLLSHSVTGHTEINFSQSPLWLEIHPLEVSGRINLSNGPQDSADT